MEYATVQYTHKLKHDWVQTRPPVKKITIINNDNWAKHTLKFPKTCKIVWEEYKKCRNQCSSLFLKLKSEYFRDFITTTSISTKKLWKKLAPYTTPNKKSVLVASAILKNTLLNTDLDLATSFCNYFASVTLVFQFLSIFTCLAFISNHFSTILIPRPPSGGLSIKPFTVEEVRDGLLALVPNSGEGDVGIESLILVECAEELSIPITFLFNLILSTGVYPDDWKCAHIIPIYKGKGSHSALDSYTVVEKLR